MKFRCILADPPWQFRDRGSRINPTYSGHYETMTDAQIIGLGDMLIELSEKNSHLWLCTPNSFLIDGTASCIAQYWGFMPKQLMTWEKDRIGMGHWLRNQTEQILFCVKGRLKPLTRNISTILHGPSKKHSEKPVQLYRAIEKVSPGPRLELFARRAIEGWSSWGDQAPIETRIK